MEEKLRKYRNELNVCGFGVMAFGVWSVIKTFFTALLSTGGIKGYLSNGTAESWNVITVLVAVFLIVAFAIDILIRIFIWRSAAKESKGLKKGWLYIALTILLILVSAGTMAAVIMSAIMSAGSGSVIDMAAALIFEASSLIVMIWLIVSVFRIRTLTRRTEEGEVKPCR